MASLTRNPRPASLHTRHAYRQKAVVPQGCYRECECTKGAEEGSHVGLPLRRDGGLQLYLGVNQGNHASWHKIALK